jgi:hypothetical protein
MRFFSFICVRGSRQRRGNNRYASASGAPSIIAAKSTPIRHTHKS